MNLKNYNPTYVLQFFHQISLANFFFIHHTIQIFSKFTIYFWLLKKLPEIRFWLTDISPPLAFIYKFSLILWCHYGYLREIIWYNISSKKTLKKASWSINETLKNLLQLQRFVNTLMRNLKTKRTALQTWSGCSSKDPKTRTLKFEKEGCNAKYLLDQLPFKVSKFIYSLS